MKGEVMKHTPGPWELDRAQKYFRIFGKIENEKYLVARIVASPNDEANGRLIVAACTSYDRHCGERAVKCAESDLLGELLEACSELHDVLKNGGTINRRSRPIYGDTYAKMLGAAIAKATGK